VREDLPRDFATLLERLSAVQPDAEQDRPRDRYRLGN
jgi:hypothetical protein